MAVRVLDHTADMGMEVDAPDLAGLYEAAVLGMVGMMFETDAWAADTKYELAGAGVDAGETLVALLSAVLVEIEVADRVPLSVSSSRSSEREAVLSGGAARLDPARVAGPAIKAVTYHGLVCERTPDGWLARIYFDV